MNVLHGAINARFHFIFVPSSHQRLLLHHSTNKYPPFLHYNLDAIGSAIRNANRGDSHESIRAKQKKYFHNVRAICANGFKPAIQRFSPPKRDSQKKEVRFGNPEPGPERIQENQAIRANLRIDSRESGHLSIINNAIDLETIVVL